MPPEPLLIVRPMLWFPVLIAIPLPLPAYITDRPGLQLPGPLQPLSLVFTCMVFWFVKIFAAANCGTLVVSRFSLVVPPKGTDPPPVRSVPAATVKDDFCRSVLVTLPAAMGNV